MCAAKAEAMFDEAEYLLANPDVAAAVQSGMFKSGQHHWKRMGRKESRPLHPVIVIPRRSRSEKLLGGLDLKSEVGIEIGPLTAPLVTKDQGATPHSFAALGAGLAGLGLLTLSCVRIDPTEYMELEFFARLRPSPGRAECIGSWQSEAARLAALPLPTS